MTTKILVIEDADALRRDIIEMLSFEDFEVRGAGNGREGVNVARSYRPDLIICDIMMPELDGYGVLAELQQDGAGITVPFIFLTARSDKGDVRTGMDAGADDYLTKPFTARELISCVRRRLNTRDKREEKTHQRLEELRESIILALPHELRTPLTGILGFSDILIADAEVMEADHIVEMAQYIHNAAQRLYRLTENYVVYAQLEVMRSDRNRVQAMRQFTTNTPRSVIENVAYLKAQYYRRENDLELSLLDDSSVKIVEDNLKKIVEELVDNAFKFSPPGSVVSIKSRLVDDQYELEILDHGRGMASEEIERVGAFMQFGRPLFEQQGSGFGLAIVRRAIELHGGEFKIDSCLGEYTRMTISLPAVPVLEPA
jgi:signal transduction histidine kinase